MNCGSWIPYLYFSQGVYNRRSLMKKIAFMYLLLLFVLPTFVSAKSIEEKYWDYVVQCLEEVQNGGAFVGGLFPSGNNSNGLKGTKSVIFDVPFENGVATATLSCEPGWYDGYATWENASRDVLFQSYYVPDTYLGPGSHSMTFLMTVNPYRAVRIKMAGEYTPDPSDEVWFNGNQAWYDDNDGLWHSWVYEPWRVIDTKAVEIVWSGHGGWRVWLTPEYFFGVILETSTMDKALSAPTRVKAVSVLAEGTYLEDDLIKLVSLQYNQNLGCEVVTLKTGFVNGLTDFTLVLSSYDEETGRWLNYYSVTLDNVGENFTIPIGGWIRPGTEARVYFTDSATGQFWWKWLNWFERGKG